MTALTLGYNLTTAMANASRCGLCEGIYGWNTRPATSNFAFSSYKKAMYH